MEGYCLEFSGIYLVSGHVKTRRMIDKKFEVRLM
jgi:hypothetical protein